MPSNEQAHDFLNFAKHIEEKIKNEISQRSINDSESVD
jgi:hypothetical protein